ncbi:MAG: SDR family oxidoreductase [Acidimicrobiia bacterium]|nr:SDR family oxidoreductase [Acidimicrobiia bacterium]
MELTDIVAVVTGGASGIGRALATRFQAEGARVAIADLQQTALHDVAGALGAPGIECDVADEAQVIALIDRVEAELGPIGLFCSNAGIGTGAGLEATDDDWRRSIDVNVMGHVYAARTLVPRMIERGGGHLLHTASAAGLLTQLGDAPYSVTKHAALALAEWLAITYGDQGIGVSCLCPQGVRTPMTESEYEGVQATVAQGLIEPEEVADAVVAALADDTFLILPHPEVRDYAMRRADDHGRWIGGMRRLQRQFFAG